MPLIIHRAERADVLAAGLAGLLAEPPDDPFGRDVVVVAAAGVERWLAQTVSHHLGTSPGRDDGICAGVDFVRPAHLVAELTDKADDDPWRPGRLAWTLLDEIDASIEEPWLEIVARHVGRGLPERDEALRRSRRYATARRTASLLHAYAVQRPWMVRSWSQGTDVDGQGRPLPPECRWQAELWRRAESRLAGHPSPDRRLHATAQGLRDGTLRHDLPPRLSFFGHTRMPHAELDVLAALGSSSDVHLWLPHASRARWASVEAPAAGVDGVPPARADVATAPRGNSLLTACARDVTELQHALLALPGETVVHHLPAPERPSTLLGLLQFDLAADVDGPGTEGPGADGPDADGPDADGPRRLDPADRSVEVHACHGPARQVEVLREVVLGLLQDDPTLEPRDVLVMCPDVETFAPLVQAAFGLDDVAGVEHPGHRLRVRLADRATTSVNPVAEVLQRVVAVAAGRRTTVAEVRDLLSLAPVRRRFGLSEDDLEKIDTWTQRTAVRWGLDADARTPWGLGGLAQNTWDAGLDQLLLGVVADPGQGTRLGGVLPLDDLASTDVDLVGRLGEVVGRLRTVLTGAVPQPLRAWTDLLALAVGSLTDVAPRDAWQPDQVLRVLASLAADREGTDDGAGGAAGGALTVVEVAAVLDDAFAPRPTRTSFRTGSLTVCTMVPMRSVPHRVVCLLGLDGDGFPRTPTPLGDDVLARHPFVGERDPSGEDRQLFLDAVLSARQHLVVTYTGASEHTGRPLPPATPVGELLDQLDRTVPGARRHVLVHHPLQSFDARSFEPGALVPDRAFSFDVAALAGARATARPATPEPPFLVDPLPPDDAPVVTLDQLRAFVSHPVRSFVRGRLDVTLPYETDPEDESIPLHLDHLQQWQVNQRVLDAVLAGATGPEAEADERRRGLLPPGVLADEALAKARGVVGRLYEIAAPLRTEPARGVDVEVDLPDGRRVVGTVADVHPGHALRTTPSRLQGRQLLLAWVDALALGAAGVGVPVHLVGRTQQGRSWSPGVRTLPALGTDEARGLLAELVDLRTLGTTRPLPLPVKTSQAYAGALRRHQPQSAEVLAGSEWRGNRDKGIDGEDVDAYHVLAFGPGLALPELLARGLDQHAMRLWTPLLDRWEGTS